MSARGSASSYAGIVLASPRGVVGRRQHGRPMLDLAKLERLLRHGKAVTELCTGKDGAPMPLSWIWDHRRRRFRIILPPTMHRHHPRLLRPTTFRLKRHGGLVSAVAASSSSSSLLGSRVETEIEVKRGRREEVRIYEALTSRPIIYKIFVCYVGNATSANLPKTAQNSAAEGEGNSFGFRSLRCRMSGITVQEGKSYNHNSLEG